MKLKLNNTITATDFARNVASVIDNVRFSGKSLDITKGSQTVVTLCPPVKTGFPISQLTKLFQELPHLGKKNALHMTDDLNTIRANADLPENLWE